MKTKHKVKIEEAKLSGKRDANKVKRAAEDAGTKAKRAAEDAGTKAKRAMNDARGKAKRSGARSAENLGEKFQQAGTRVKSKGRTTRTKAG